MSEDFSHNVTVASENWIDRVEELPTLPTIIYELIQIVNNPFSSTSDVEKVMANDPSLTAKVLKLVNSAYYAIPGGVSHLGRAIGYIGFDTIYQLVLSSSIIRSLHSESCPRFDLSEFWKHSAGVGVAAESIGEELGHPNPSELFTSGVVHDIGKVALLTLDRHLFESLVNEAFHQQIDYYEMETRLSIPAHTDIGASLLKRWKLPRSLQITTRLHHSKHRQEETLSVEMQRNVDIVFTANRLVHALNFGSSGSFGRRDLDRVVLERLDLCPETAIPRLGKTVKTSLESAEEFFKVLSNE